MSTRKIYGYSYKELTTLPEKVRGSIFNAMEKKNKPFADKFLEEHPNYGYIVVGKRTRKIVSFGGVRAEPTEKKLNKIAKRINGPVLAFTRSKDTQEV